MNKKYWIIAFIAVLIAYIISMQLNNEQLQYVIKSLIIPVLIGYFISQTKSDAGNIKIWILAALFFSWVGDILLLFQDKKDIFFLLGLSSFLLAHVFYIIFFHNIRVMENIKSNVLLLLIVVVYYAALTGWLSPYLGKMNLPVRIYGIVISFMFMLAMHMLFISNKKAGRWLMIGALLFVVSDSVLAINKFYLSFEMAGYVIIATYGVAQLFITEGAIQYIRRQ